MFSTIFKAGDDTLHFVAITQTELNVAPVFVVKKTIMILHNQTISIVFIVFIERSLAPDITDQTFRRPPVGGL